MEKELTINITLPNYFSSCSTCPIILEAKGRLTKKLIKDAPKDALGVNATIVCQTYNYSEGKITPDYTFEYILESGSDSGMGSYAVKTCPEIDPKKRRR